MDLDADIDELYVVPPSSFVRRRSDLAAAAQRSGDRAAAAEIKKLRKPTLGAWLANLLVHEHGDQIDELLQLGETLRAAQLHLAGAELRRLVQQRRAIIGSLVTEARGLARHAGQPVADEAARELEATLAAALASESAGATLRSGRLTSALEHVGFGPLERDPGTAASGVAAKSRSPQRAKAPELEAMARLEQCRADAERVLRESKAAVSNAAKELVDLQRKLAGLRRNRDQRGREVEDLERRLAGAKSIAASVENDLAEAEKATREAEWTAIDAKKRLALAEEEVGRFQT